MEPPSPAEGGESFSLEFSKVPSPLLWQSKIPREKTTLSFSKISNIPFLFFLVRNDQLLCHCRKVNQTCRMHKTPIQDHLCSSVNTKHGLVLMQRGFASPEIFKNSLDSTGVNSEETCDDRTTYFCNKNIIYKMLEFQEMIS